MQDVGQAVRSDYFANHVGIVPGTDILEGDAPVIYIEHFIEPDSAVGDEILEDHGVPIEILPLSQEVASHAADGIGQPKEVAGAIGVLDHVGCGNLGQFGECRIIQPVERVFPSRTISQINPKIGTLGGNCFQVRPPG